MKQLICVLIAVALLSCGQNERPEGIMDREAFKAALLDAQLIEARMNHEMVLEQMEVMPAQKYYEELFEKHGITDEQFNKTFRYYSKQPDELGAIYEEIIAELTLRKDSIL